MLNFVIFSDPLDARIQGTMSVTLCLTVQNVVASSLALVLADNGDSLFNTQDHLIYAMKIVNTAGNLFNKSIFHLFAI